jgi:hypothetical protein
MNQSGGLSAKYSISQSAGQLVIWLVSESDRQSFGRTVDVSVNLTLSQKLRHPVTEATNQLITISHTVIERSWFSSVRTQETHF